MARHVTITGTRSIATGSESVLADVFDAYLRPFADAEATFCLGGAAGIDTMVLVWLAANTRASLMVVVPCTVGDQPDVAREAIDDWRRRGRITEVTELRAERLDVSAYHTRNRWMVDRSGFVIAFPRGNGPTSGTWYTVNYAAEQGKPRLIVPV